MTGLQPSPETYQPPLVPPASTCLCGHPAANHPERASLSLFQRLEGEVAGPGPCVACDCRRFEAPEIGGEG